jgi:hypothetical protein
MLQRAMALLRSPGMPRVPLVIGELNYSVFPCRQEVDLAGGLLNAETMAQFLCEGGGAAYYYGYEPNKLDGSNGSWGNQLMLLARGDRMVPVATFQTLQMLSQEWMDPHGGSHTAFPTKITGGSGMLRAYALRRPDGSVALLLINTGRDSAEVTLRGIIPKTKMVYGGDQYQWLADGRNGHPVRNFAPERKPCPAGSIVLPGFSLTVVH